MTQMKAFLVLLMLIPAFVAADSNCPLTMSQKLLSSGRRYNTYLGTIQNPSTLVASNIVFSTSASLHSIDDVLTVTAGYMIDGQTTIDPQGTYSFTYSAPSGISAQWSFTCSISSHAAQPTAVPVQATAAPVKATTAPVQATAAPVKATVAPVKATTAPVQGTTAPVKATTAPVRATTAPVQATSAPVKATTAPVQAAAPSASGRKCPAGTWWRPHPSTSWQWQLTGTIDTSINVQMYDIDLFDNTAETISTLHSQGRVVICYFSTQYEDWRPDAALWTANILGSNLDNWAGEKYVDIRSPTVRSIMQSRLDLAVTKGCDGVEPDNVDGFEASTGFPLTAADQINFNQFVASEAHARGLSVGLKNDGDQAALLEPSFDWALNEQCYQYKECAPLTTFISSNKAVFNCEYKGAGATICPVQNRLSFSTLVKSLDLTAAITAQCCTFAVGGCTPAGYDCVSS